MNAPLYTTDILRLAASLSEPRDLQRQTGVAELRSPTCGSRMTTVVEVDSAARILALSQRVHACAFGQAAAALVEQGAIGRSRDEFQAAIAAIEQWLADNGPMPSWPGIEALAPARPRQARHGAILLPFRALLAALDTGA